MRLMLIGTDRLIFSPGSAVRERLARFGTYVGAQDSIVFSVRAHKVGGVQELAPEVHAYPTQSRSRLLYGWDAITIAKRLPRPDAVSAQDPFETGLAAWLIARYFGVPLMVELHTDFLAPEFARHSPLNRIRVLIAAFVLARASGGYAVSERVRRAVEARYPKAPPLALLPIYVDTSRFAAVHHEPHPRFGAALAWVGRLEPEKQPGLALRALAAARTAGFDAGLTFVGAGSLLGSLRREAAELGLTKYVEFAGHGDPMPHLAHADLLLVTSQYEGYGMAMVEALAAGVPVLSTDVGVAREVGAVIADGDYPAALCTWLGGSRTRGALAGAPYTNETEYFAAIKKYYESVALPV